MKLQTIKTSEGWVPLIAKSPKIERPTGGQTISQPSYTTTITKTLNKDKLREEGYDVDNMVKHANGSITLKKVPITFNKKRNGRTVETSTYTPEVVTVSADGEVLKQTKYGIYRSDYSKGASGQTRYKRDVYVKSNYDKSKNVFQEWERVPVGKYGKRQKILTKQKADRHYRKKDALEAHQRFLDRIKEMVETEELKKIRYDPEAKTLITTETKRQIDLPGYKTIKYTSPYTGKTHEYHTGLETKFVPQVIKKDIAQFEKDKFKAEHYDQWADAWARKIKQKGTPTTAEPWMLPTWEDMSRIDTRYLPKTFSDRSTMTYVEPSKIEKAKKVANEILKGSPLKKWVKTVGSRLGLTTNEKVNAFRATKRDLKKVAKAVGLDLNKDKDLITAGDILLFTAAGAGIPVISTWAKGGVAGKLIDDRLAPKKIREYAEFFKQTLGEKSQAYILAKAYADAGEYLVKRMEEIGQSAKDLSQHSFAYRTASLAGQVMPYMAKYAIERPVEFYYKQKAFGESAELLRAGILKYAPKVKIPKTVSPIIARGLTDAYDIGSDVLETLPYTPPEHIPSMIAGYTIANYAIDYPIDLYNRGLGAAFRRYPLKPYDTVLRKEYKKEFDDLSKVVRIATNQPIEIIEPRFARVKGADSKIAKDIETFFKGRTDGVIGGSVVHEMTGIDLAMPPNDIEFYANNQNKFLNDAKSFFKKKGYKVTFDKGKLYIGDVKIDLNPISQAENNIRSVSVGNWENYILKTDKGIRVIDPRIMVRRALVGAFEKGSKAPKKEMARYSKDMQRAMAMLSKTVSNLRATTDLGYLRRSKRAYDKRLAELLLDRYATDLSQPRISKKWYRGYDRTKVLPKPLTKADKKLIAEMTKKGGYLGGSSALYFQIPEFRKYRDLDMYFRGKSRAELNKIARDIARTGKFEVDEGAHQLIYPKMSDFRVLWEVPGLYPSKWSPRMDVGGRFQATLQGREQLKYKQLFDQRTKAHEIVHKIMYDYNIDPKKIKVPRDYVETNEYLQKLEDDLKDLKYKREKVTNELKKSSISAERKNFLTTQKNILNGRIKQAEWYNKIEAKVEYLVDFPRESKQIIKEVRDKIGLQEVADISNIPRKEIVNLAGDIPVRNWQHILDDKLNILKNTVPGSPKYNKALQDVRAIQEGIKKDFPTKYNIRNRFPQLRAISAIEAPLGRLMRSKRGSRYIAPGLRRAKRTYDLPYDLRYTETYNPVITTPRRKSTRYRLPDRDRYPYKPMMTDIPGTKYPKYPAHTEYNVYDTPPVRPTSMYTPSTYTPERMDLYTTLETLRPEKTEEETETRIPRDKKSKKKTEWRPKYRKHSKRAWQDPTYRLTGETRYSDILNKLLRERYGTYY